MNLRRFFVVFIIICIVIGGLFGGYGLIRYLSQKAASEKLGNTSPQSSESAENNSHAFEAISVMSPKPNETVASPFTLSGQANVFENILKFRLKDSRGVLVEEFVTADSPDIGQFGPYSITITYADPASDTGVLEVFSLSPKDGSEINTKSIPIRFVR